MSDGQRDLVLEMFGLLNSNINELKAEMKKDVNAIYEKLNTVSDVTNENLVVAKTQNSRIYKLEKKHEDCPGAKALARQTTDDAVDEIKNSKSNKLGEYILQTALTASVASAILGFYMWIKSHIV